MNATLGTLLRYLPPLSSPSSFSLSLSCSLYATRTVPPTLAARLRHPPITVRLPPRVAGSRASDWSTRRRARTPKLSRIPAETHGAWIPAGCDRRCFHHHHHHYHHHHHHHHHTTPSSSSSPPALSPHHDRPTTPYGHESSVTDAALFVVRNQNMPNVGNRCCKLASTTCRRTCII